jgi:outer membrane lipopolysaccharide assembly protein LptE/RlpB
MKYFFTLAFTVHALLLSGCAGYQLGGQKPHQLREVHTLAVPSFENLTLEPRLAVNVTNAVITKLQSHGSYQLANRSNADAVLVGTIRNIQRNQFRADRTNVLRTSQMQLIVAIDYQIKDRSGRVMHSNSVTGESQTLIDPNLQLSETQALEDAAQRAAINLANDICEGW